MNTLVSHPALYGWNWSDEINGGGGLGDIPAHSVARLLNADPLVGGWTGVYFSTLQIDGMNVPVMGGSPNAAVGPPLLSGHAFDGANQIVLGASTLVQLHKHVGDTVVVGAPGTGLHDAPDRRDGHVALHRSDRFLPPRNGDRCPPVVHVDPTEGPQRLRRAVARPERRPGPLQEGGEPDCRDCLPAVDRPQEPADPRRWGVGGRC